jgi:2-oxoglutarate ferredoxin oxidoreductase subunit beta
VEASDAPYFVDLVKDALGSKHSESDLNENAYRIYTTIDPDLQHAAAESVAEGIKLANPELKVICFAGDGDCYGEGLEHLIFAAKRNIDITVFVHNNRVYGLTTGQYTPTSPLGFKGRSTPAGTQEAPLNPLEIALVSGATFIARGYSNNLEVTKNIMKEAVLHKGFSLVDILQVCLSFFNLYDSYNKNTYALQNHNFSDFNEASNKIREWNYNSAGPISLGKLYQVSQPSFEENFMTPELIPDRQPGIDEILKKS